MTKLGALVCGIVSLAIATVACGRSDLSTPDLGDASTGCQTTADCPTGQTCDPNSHTCVPNPTGCNSDSDCTAPTPHCRTDVHVCVECITNSQCPASEVCNNFRCVAHCGAGGTCPSGRTCCNTYCVDETTDPGNCGSCSNACGPYPNVAVPDCVASNCGIQVCDPGSADCNKIVKDGCEVNTNSDPSNCGACGNQCPSGDQCSGGVCVGGCGTGGKCPGLQTCCGTQCENTSTDPNNCGSCGNVCGPAPQATTTCAGGMCVIASCQPGFADCDHLEKDGCEANLNSDNANCGGCGNRCAAGSSCINAICVPANCKMTGCSPPDTCCGTTCANTTNDLANCGGCGNACPPNANMCQNGACCFLTPMGEVCGTVVCPPPLSNCNNMCVDENNDPRNCGFCGNVCGPMQACIGGNCVNQCNGGPGCMGNQQCCMTGCSDVTNDPKNCGSCGHACPPGDKCMASTCVAPMTCNGGPPCTGSLKCCMTGCSDTTKDPLNCGGCGQACLPGDTCVNSMCVAPMSCNGGPPCLPGQTCCMSGCSNLKTDPNNCGMCGITCGATASCSDGTCAVNEGAFDPMVNPTFLSPGVHNFTTINVPAGVTVYVAGGGPASGTLDLNATGTIVIDGTIDLSGGPGVQSVVSSQSTQTGRAGAGGYTGEPYQSAGLSSSCQWVGGNAGALGFPLAGTVGTCTAASSTTCIGMNDPLALLFTSNVTTGGGGAGVFSGYRAYGSGGGGPGGGAPGALGAAYPGESDCSGASGGGGAINGQGGLGGGGPYDGQAGVLGVTQCAGAQPGIPQAYVGGAGGGSIGPQAAMDLAVATTFQTGSGGGGGSGDYLNRPAFGGTSGGGGAGGALKLSTPVSITITGQLLTNGGAGGDSYIGTGSNAGCDPQPGAGGGGGSGGIIYLSAPVLTVAPGATISAAGGPGGAGSEFATGGGGGVGGLGRVRISASTATCMLGGSFNPPLSTGCNPTPNLQGFAYVAAWPQ